MRAIQAGTDSRTIGRHSRVVQAVFDSRAVQAGTDSRAIQAGTDSRTVGRDSRVVQAGSDSRPYRQVLARESYGCCFEDPTVAGSRTVGGYLIASARHRVVTVANLTKSPSEILQRGASRRIFNRFG